MDVYNLIIWSIFFMDNFELAKQTLSNVLKILKINQLYNVVYCFEF
jgi:hypothetical protein